MDDDILLVDDDPGSIQLMANILSDTGNLTFAVTGEDALRLARASIPDLILLDAEMPGMSGFLVCETLKADQALSHVPVIFVTSHTEPEFEVSGFGLGAADFIAKPVNAALVLARVKAQLHTKHLADDLRHIATTDVLTGLANRRFLDESLEREWRVARRAGDDFALLMIDVDHFKAFNDRYGHSAGDACLHAVARAVASAGLRPADLAARYGGEEFVVMLPGTPRAGAEHVAQAILEAVEALAVAHEASTTAAHVTVSIGIAFHESGSAHGESAAASAGLRPNEEGSARPGPEDLMRAADRALYAAKRGGRARANVQDLGDLGTPVPSSAAVRRPACPSTGRHHVQERK